MARISPPERDAVLARSAIIALVAFLTLVDLLARSPAARPVRGLWRVARGDGRRRQQLRHWHGGGKPGDRAHRKAPRSAAVDLISLAALSVPTAALG